jgi:hypothetical protein
MPIHLDLQHLAIQSVIIIYVDFYGKINHYMFAEPKNGLRAREYIQRRRERGVYLYCNLCKSTKSHEIYSFLLSSSIPFTSPKYKILLKKVLI